MDGIGAEVSQKIRSAIKAKLMELGAYVDEELPDYIMVMVANKRSREQMEEDLQLFLASNTEEFTLWLHQVLQKLQEVTVASLERKRKSSNGESEGETAKKEKRKKTSERKKIKRSIDQTKGKDTKTDSENNKQPSEKTEESEKVTKSPNTTSSQIKFKNAINFNKKVENLDETQEKMDKVPGARTDVVSHTLVITSSSEKHISTKTSAPITDKKDSNKLQGDVTKSKLESLQDLGKVFKKVSVSGKSESSGKNVSSVEESTHAPQRILNVQKKGASNESEIVDTRQHITCDTKIVDKTPIETDKAKIILMQSDDEDDDDDDDDDFINIKADAEAEELLGKELPNEIHETSSSSAVKVSSNVDNKRENITISPPEDKQKISTVQRLHLSSRLGTHVSSGSVLDRLGVRKVTALSRDISKSNSPLLRATDNLDNRVVSRISDRLGVRKVNSLRSNDKDVQRNSNIGDKQCSVPPRLINRLGGRIISSCIQSDKRSISLTSRSERNVAQVAPTTIYRTSRLSNIRESQESEQLGLKSQRRPLVITDEDGSNDKNQTSRKRPLLSRVVAMHREGNKEEEEEYDPSNPAVGSVASIVRVKPRPKIPAALQANKNLILKAVAEAQKSVANAPKRVEPEDRPDGLFTKKFRGKDKVAVTLPNRRMQPQKETVVNEKSSDIERIVIPVKLEATRSISGVNLQQKIVIQVSSGKPVQHETEDSSEETVTSKFEDDLEENVTTNSDAAYEEDTKLILNVSANEAELKEDVYNEDQKLNYETQTWSRDLELETNIPSTQPIERVPVTESVRFSEMSRAESPQFVVTLDGIDPSIFNALTRKKETQLQQTSNIMDNSNTESEIPVIEYEEKDISGSEDEQRKKQTDKRSASPILYKKSSTSDVTGSTPDALKQKINERCKYWPACRSGDKCEYLHPTVPCKSFPSCKFGDKCLYIHPNCKFDAACTRRDCPFTHASPRNRGSTVASVSATPRTRSAITIPRSSQQVCKFFPKCSNVNCQFLHPKPCRYGRYCSRRTECSFLHEDIPSADKLKWFCPFRL